MAVAYIWDGTQWVEVSSSLGTLDGLSDVVVTTPADGEVLTYSSATSKWINAAAAAGGGSSVGVWQRAAARVLQGTGNKSTTSTVKGPIDSTNLPFDTVAGLAVGDRVRCSFTAQGYCSAGGGHVVGIDVEVDQPTSANTYIGASCDYGIVAAGFATPAVLAFVAEFVVTEAGDHGFRPVFNCSSASGIIGNATSGLNDSLISWFVDKALA